MCAARSGPVVLIVLIVLLALAAPLGARPLGPLAAGAPHASAGAGMILINEGAPWTTKRAVTLKLKASSMGGKPSKMRFSVDRKSWSAWESYAETRAYTLPAGDGANKLVFVQFENSAGDRRIDHDTIGLDTVAPESTDDADLRLHDAAVTVTLTAADATSGVAAVSYRLDGGAWQRGSSFTVPAPAGTVRAYAVDYFATDIAGNAESPRSCTVKIDTVHDVTVPVTTSSADDAWHNSDVRVTFAVSGPGQPFTTRYRLDGGPWQTGSSFTVPAPGDHSNDGVHALEYYTTNAWDNVEDVNAATVRIDTEAPVTGDDAPAEWSQDDVVLTFSPRDTLSSTVTRYRVDKGPWQEGTVLMVPANADKTNDGIHTVDYYSTDAAGNAETAHACQVKINVPAIARAFTVSDDERVAQVRDWGGLAVDPTGDSVVLVWSEGIDADIFLGSTPLCTAPGDQTAPAISGETVVWADHRGGDWDIYAYDLASETELPLCTAPGDQTAPAISGETVVWADHRGADWDIYAYDLASATELPLCTAPGDQTAPAISGETVVWADHRGGDWDIYTYDLASATELPLCTAPGDQKEPDVSGDRAVWTDTRAGGADIYGCRLDTGEEVLWCGASGAQWAPHVSTSAIAWSDSRNGNVDVYGYDLVRSKPVAICMDPDDQLYPVLSRDVVSWVDTRAGCWNVMSRSLSLGESSRLPAMGAVKGAQHAPTEPVVTANKVFWLDHRDTSLAAEPYERRDGVYSYDLATRTERRIAAATERKGCLEAFGNNLVWASAGDLGDLADIHWYNVATGDTRVIRTGMVGHLDVSDARIAWTGVNQNRKQKGVYIYTMRTGKVTLAKELEFRRGAQADVALLDDEVILSEYVDGSFNIYRVDLKKGETTPLSVGAGQQICPEAYGRYAAWLDVPRLGDTGQVVLCDLQTGDQSEVGAARAYLEGVDELGSPLALDENALVWTDAATGDVAGIDLRSGSSFRICGPLRCDKPNVNGSTVVWCGSSLEEGEPVHFVKGSRLAAPQPDRVQTVAPGSFGECALSGDVVVWQEAREGATDLRGYDRSTSTEFDVSIAPGAKAGPDVSGSLIVWSDERAGDADIYALDLAAPPERPLCEAVGQQMWPAVDGSTVVWEDDRSGSSDIYAYDLIRHAEVAVCTASGDQARPDVSGSTIVWQDARSGVNDIYGYDLAVGQEFVVCAAEDEQEAPSVDGSIVVWRDHRRGQWDLYCRDLVLQVEYRIAEDVGVVEPRISEGLVTWVGERGVCVYSIQTDTVLQIPGSVDATAGAGRPALDGNTVVWANHGVHGATLTYPQWTTELEILPEGGAAALPSRGKLPAFAALAAPPAARAAGAAPARWIRTRAVRLALAASSDQGEVAEMALSDGGVTYGAWESYAESRPFTLSAGDGVKTVAVVFRDSEDLVSPVASAVIGVDTKRPTTSAWAATATRGRKAALKYRVSDAASKLVWHTVQIKVKNARGKVVKKVTLKKQPTAQTRTWKFTCRLAKGRYRYYVYATDAAGNVQSRVGSARLVVR